MRFAPRMLARLQQLPELSDVASDQQVLGLRAKLVFDRDTAAPLRHHRGGQIDQALYDAYGQRQISTMFTQLNQYHVVLEVKPEFKKSPSSLGDLFIRTARPRGCPAAVFHWAVRFSRTAAFPNGGADPAQRPLGGRRRRPGRSP